jgi:hypothetical protein
MDAMNRKLDLGMKGRPLKAGAPHRPVSTDLRQSGCHTMPSNFALNSLKIDDRHPLRVAHFFEAPGTPTFPNLRSGSGKQGSDAT